MARKSEKSIEETQKQVRPPERIQKKAALMRKFKKLRIEMAKSLRSSPQQNIKKLEKAFDEDFSNLNEEQIIAKISTFSIEKLEKAELEVAGTGAILFARLKEGETLNPISYGRKFKEGEKLVIKFPSKESEDHYGMRTLFKNQPQIRKIRITQHGPRGNNKEGMAVRHSWNGNFYFTEGPYKGRYAPIFSDTEIEIIDVWDTNERKTAKKGYFIFEFGKDKKDKRGINEEDIDFFRDQYGFEPPSDDLNSVKTNVKKQLALWHEYFKKIDEGTERKYEKRPKRQRKPKYQKQEFIPRSQLEEQFYTKWREIEQINNPERLMSMVEEITMRPNDPMVLVPGERRGTRLRSGAALRYALFKRYAELKGIEVSISSSFRSTEHQRRLWNKGLAKRMAKLRKRYPGISYKSLRRKAIRLNRRYVAPPGRSHHNTGGAVDLRFYEKETGRKIEMHKFRNERKAYNYALRTRDLSRLSQNDRLAIKTRIFLEDELNISHFLGVNYYAENWHWNVDGRKIYRNV